MSTCLQSARLSERVMTSYVNTMIRSSHAVELSAGILRVSPLRAGQVIGEVSHKGLIRTQALRKYG